MRVNFGITKDLQEKETSLYKLNKKVGFLTTDLEKDQVKISELDKKTKQVKGKHRQSQTQTSSRFTAPGIHTTSE